MLLRGAYFNAKSGNLELTRNIDKQFIKILHIEKIPQSYPLMQIEVINEIPTKLAKLWQVPYAKIGKTEIKPMMRTVITWDVSSVIRYWQAREEYSQFNKLEYVGDPRNKKMHELEKATDWMPLNPKIEYYKISFKTVGKSILPEEDVLVTDPKLIKEMGIMGIGGGVPVIGRENRYKDMSEQWNSHETFPYLRWEFFTSVLDNGQTAYGYHIRQFYIEFLDTRFDIKEAYQTHIPGYQQKMTYYGSLREYAGRDFKDYNEYADEYYEMAKGDFRE